MFGSVAFIKQKENDYKQNYVTSINIEARD